VKSLIDTVKAESVLLLCHQNADPDALCSAFALSELLKRLNPEMKVDIACPEGISRLSEPISAHLQIETASEEPNFGDADVIVMVDTNTIQQLGGWSKALRESSSPLVVIDHHASHPETENVATVCISDENSSSTCEIIYGFYRELGLTPSKKVAEALFTGMASDTKHFTLASSETFKAAAALVEAGVDAQEALSRLSVSVDVSERIARLKACKRAELVRFGDWLIAFSHVRSYQASAARGLLEIGAHVAFVGGQRGDQIQISIRACQDFFRQTGFHLGRDLARPLGEYLQGMGGGHSTAAGVNGVGDFDAAVKKAVKILKEKIGKSSSTSSH